MLTSILFALLTASYFEPPPVDTTTWGPAIPVGNDTIQSFLTITASGEPRSLGVQLSFDFDSLPPEPGDHGPGYEYLVPLPEDAAAVVPFDHVAVDWNPLGHIPQGVYDWPHLDVHFYLISLLERAEIAPGECDGQPPVTCEALARATAPLHPSAQPPFHSSLDNGVVPQMGNHLVDRRSPEFGPEGFSNTFLFGTWDGKIAFLEPMLTMAWLQALVGEDCRTIDNPETFARAGWYPTAYCVRTDGDSTTIVTLEDFAWYSATGDV